MKITTEQAALDLQRHAAGFEEHSPEHIEACSRVLDEAFEADYNSPRGRAYRRKSGGSKGVEHADS